MFSWQHHWTSDSVLDTEWHVTFCWQCPWRWEWTLGAGGVGACHGRPDGHHHRPPAVHYQERWPDRRAGLRPSGRTGQLRETDDLAGRSVQETRRAPDAEKQRPDRCQQWHRRGVVIAPPRRWHCSVSDVIMLCHPSGHIVSYYWWRVWHVMFCCQWYILCVSDCVTNLPVWHEHCGTFIHVTNSHHV